MQKDEEHLTEAWTVYFLREGVCGITDLPATKFYRPTALLQFLQQDFPMITLDFNNTATHSATSAAHGFELSRKLFQLHRIKKNSGDDRHAFTFASFGFSCVTVHHAFFSLDI